MQQAVKHQWGDDTTEITSSEGTSGTDLSDLSVTYSKEDFGLYTPPDKDGNSSFIIGLDEDKMLYLLTTMNWLVPCCNQLWC